MAKSSLKKVFVGAGALNPALKNKFLNLGWPAVETYGMTETVSHIALKRLNGKEKTDYYKVLKGVEINIDKRNCLTIKSEVTNGKILITNDVVEIISGESFKWLFKN